MKWRQNHLMRHLLEAYVVLTHELGLQLPRGKWRAADIVIYHQDQLRSVPLHNRYRHSAASGH